jgi:hypothetical protein
LRRKVMTIKVKSLTEVVKKWTTNAAGAQVYYESSVKGAGQDWLNATSNAGAAFKAGVSAGNIQTLFEGGVKKAGAEKYTRKAGEVGPGRFSQGVAAGSPDYSSGVDPMLQTIGALTLSTRGPRGSAANIQRVSQVADALHKKRLALRGG